MNKKVTLSAITFLVAGLGILGVTTVSAEDIKDPNSTIVQKIADKFGLNKDEVQAVFNQERTERNAQKNQKFEERLTKLFTDGKLTENQKKLIIDKRAELEKKMQDNISSMQDLTPDERKSQMQSSRAELKAWAESNRISEDLLFEFGGKGGHGMGKFKMKFTNPTVTPTQ